jgi:hypothetical protein
MWPTWSDEQSVSGNTMRNLTDLQSLWDIEIWDTKMVTIIGCHWNKISVVVNALTNNYCTLLDCTLLEFKWCMLGNSSSVIKSASQRLYKLDISSHPFLTSHPIPSMDQYILKKIILVRKHPWFYMITIKLRVGSGNRVPSFFGLLSLPHFPVFPFGTCESRIPVDGRMFHTILKSEEWAHQWGPAQAPGGMCKESRTSVR